MAASSLPWDAMRTSLSWWPKTEDSGGGGGCCEAADSGRPLKPRRGRGRAFAAIRSSARLSFSSTRSSRSRAAALRASSSSTCRSTCHSSWAMSAASACLASSSCCCRSCSASWVAFRFSSSCFAKVAAAASLRSSSILFFFSRAFLRMSCRRVWRSCIFCHTDSCASSASAMSLARFMASRTTASFCSLFCSSAMWRCRPPAPRAARRLLSLFLTW
mmetsp:Transcript_29876/g.84220  ORF Transcript_29876/g.84220 Transcript_29876/m.84220 type:complete len:217 (-) Transcript_29876:366-1016(-)